MFMRVASLYDATAFAWGFCRACHHGILVKREWVTNCVVKSSGFFLVVFVFLFTVVLLEHPRTVKRDSALLP